MIKPIPFPQVEAILMDMAQQVKNRSMENYFILEDDIEGCPLFRFHPVAAKQMYNIDADHVRIELICVHKGVNPHVHEFAEAGFLFLGPEHGYEDLERNYIAFGDWNRSGESILSLYNLTPGLITKVPPKLVHGFVLHSDAPLWFLGVHSPLIHENGDIKMVPYVLSDDFPKRYNPQLLRI